MTTMTETTLADFLLARIAEDEAAVRHLTSADWAHDGSPSPTLETPMARAWHVEFTLGRVLAECEAKRRIVERCSRAIVENETIFSREPHQSPDFYVGYEMLAEHASAVLAELALPYADHPDYRDEFKP